VDIWEDLYTLRFFQHGKYPPQVTSSHQDRIQQRFKRYSWKENHLLRCLPQGDIMVPPPHERPGFIQKVHSKLGHFEVIRTCSLFAPHYHWRGMYAEIRDIIAKCEWCDRVKTSFSSWQLMFFPLPIQGMFYRWSCDLLESYHKPLGVMSTSWLWMSIFQNGSNLLHCQTSHHIAPAKLSYNMS
jgi:hypothetical protein